MNRRNFMIQGGLSAAVLYTPDFIFQNQKNNHLFIFSLSDVNPVIIDSIETWKINEDILIQVKSKGGHFGRIPANEKIIHLMGILNDLIVPFFIGKNAREVESIIREIYRVNSNYKYAGMPFWICVAHVELAILDMLANVENKPVGQLFGSQVREKFPVYLSTFDRENLAEIYVDHVKRDLGEFKAVKIKIGGRMSNNQDCIEGRTEKLIPQMRNALGNEITLYVDANSSYDAPKAIEVGRMLEEYQYSFFEEPCPWQDYLETQKVAAHLDIPVAGGEQDSSQAQFMYMIDQHVVDIIQPDIMYNGGFIRTLKIAEYAGRAGMSVTLHSPQSGASNAFKMQFASIVPNIGPFQEFTPGMGYEWCSIPLDFHQGALLIVNKPGWGIDYDEEYLKKAIRI